MSGEGINMKLQINSINSGHPTGPLSLRFPVIKMKVKMYPPHGAIVTTHRQRHA